MRRTIASISVLDVYKRQAIERFGIIRGGLLAVWRLLRCNPLFPGGLDPVPEKRNKKKG